MARNILQSICLWLDSLAFRFLTFVRNDMAFWTIGTAPIIKKVLLPYMLICFPIILPFQDTLHSQTIKIGSKNFPESNILAEIMAQLLEDRGFSVERRFGLGGTIICYQGLANAEIDIYPEYSGTIEQAILKLQQSPSYSDLQNLLRENHSLELLDSFGFNNTYAFAVRAEFAKSENLKNMSDLRSHPDLRFGLSQEFLETRNMKRKRQKHPALILSLLREHPPFIPPSRGD